MDAALKMSARDELERTSWEDEAALLSSFFVVTCWLMSSL